MQHRERVALGVVGLGALLVFFFACEDGPEDPARTRTEVSVTPNACADDGEDVVLRVKMTGRPPDECRPADAKRSKIMWCAALVAARCNAMC